MLPSNAAARTEDPAAAPPPAPLPPKVEEVFESISDPRSSDSPRSHTPPSQLSLPKPRLERVR